MSSDFWHEFCARRGAGEEYLLAREKGTEADVIRKLVNSESEGELNHLRRKEVKKMENSKMRRDFFLIPQGWERREKAADGFPRTDFSGAGRD